MSGEVDIWCGRGVLVVTFTGVIGPTHVARLRGLRVFARRFIVVVDLRHADTSDTDTLLVLMRRLSALRRSGARVVLANAPADVAVAARPLSIQVVDTSEKPLPA